MRLFPTPKNDSQLRDDLYRDVIGMHGAHPVRFLTFVAVNENGQIVGMISAKL